MASTCARAAAALLVGWPSRASPPAQAEERRQEQEQGSKGEETQNRGAGCAPVILPAVLNAHETPPLCVNSDKVTRYNDAKQRSCDRIVMFPTVAAFQQCRGHLAAFGAHESFRNMTFKKTRLAEPYLVTARESGLCSHDGTGIRLTAYHETDRGATAAI